MLGARVEKLTEGSMYIYIYVGSTLTEGMVSQALKELTAICSTRYAAIQHKKAQNE
jgi:hypothetical protein